jgi:hypothetical protein
MSEKVTRKRISRKEEWKLLGKENWGPLREEQQKEEKGGMGKKEMKVL